jgi:dihydropteroate synthase
MHLLNPNFAVFKISTKYGFNSYKILIEEVEEKLANEIISQIKNIGINFEISKSSNDYINIEIYLKSEEEYSKFQNLKSFAILDDASKCLINYLSTPSYIKIGSRLFDFSKKSYIMGILNVTPDSFYDGGRYFNFDSALNRSFKIIEENADIIDVGGQSTRPGSIRISEEEEIRRVIPVIKEIRKKSDIPISIDTYYSRVAEEAISAGADLINDISGLIADLRMPEICLKYNVPIVLMHIRGNPSIMQKNIHYNNVVVDILRSLRRKIIYAKEKGLSEKQLLIDPGLGFGKHFEENIEIIRHLDVFKCLGLPILVGHSRKSFVGKIIGNLPVEERLEASLAMLAYMIIKGANIIRVHDVKESVRVREVIDKLLYFN